MLSSKSLPVHRLAQEFEISRPAVSRHLRVLKDAGLVREEKEGRENVYSLEAHRLRALNSWISRFWSQRLTHSSRWLRPPPRRANWNSISTLGAREAGSGKEAIDQKIAHQRRNSAGGCTFVQQRLDPFWRARKWLKTRPSTTCSSIR